VFGFCGASDFSPSLLAFAAFKSLCFFSTLVSGACLSKSLNTWVAVFLSNVLVN